MNVTDLTDKTYTAIIEEAENFDEILSEQFALLTGQCSDEKDFINQAMDLTKGMLTYDEDEIDELFEGEAPPIVEIHHTLKRILENIENLQS